MANEIAPHQAPLPESTRTVYLFDRVNPMCLLNLLPDAVATRLEDAAQNHPEYFDKDEIQLFKWLRSIGEQPTAADNRLRLKFWVEYDRISLHNGKMKMVMKNVSAGLCTEEYFYNVYLKHPSRLAWLANPPVGYMAKMSEALDFAVDQLREILSVTPGQYDKNYVPVMALKLQIAKMLDDRVRGAVVQKIEQKSMQVNVQATASEINQITGQMSMDELDKKLAELKDQDGGTRNANKRATNHSTNADAIVVESHHVPNNK